MTERVVFDCNIYFQALISPRGPAGQCLSIAERGDLTLFISEIVIDELVKVCSRPALAAQFKLTAERLDRYEKRIRASTTIVADVPQVFTFERDPDDEHYIDLAVACVAKLIVSRDKDLLALMDNTTKSGIAFQDQFPDIEIMGPVELLSRIGKKQ